MLAPMPGPSRVRIGADVGGTFTDVVLQSDSGEVRMLKVLSTPPAYDRAVVDAVRDLLGSDDVVAEVVHGTTVATNAVLEKLGRGPRSSRPWAFATCSSCPDADAAPVRLLLEEATALVPRRLRFEVEERMSAAGEVVRALAPEEAVRVARELRDANVESIAVCLLHAHLYPEHERLLGEVLRAELPDVPVSLSLESCASSRSTSAPPRPP